MWATECGLQGGTITSTEKPAAAKTDRCDKNVDPEETWQQEFLAWRCTVKNFQTTASGQIHQPWDYRDSTAATSLD